MPETDNRLVTNTDDLTTQIANILKNGLNQNPKHNMFDGLKISLSLNSQNYALWSRMIRVAIGGKSKALFNHLTTKPPEKTDESYEQWEQDDLTVFSWLIQNIDPEIASNLTEFPTAKTLWEALVITYSSGKDKLQTFDLHVKANEIKQKGMPLENLWIMMQGIWGEIDRRDPNPMTCATDIAAYNKIRTQQKLFQFLNALDHKHDSIKREIIRWDPLPTAEGAYAAVRKETAHQTILGVTSGETSASQGVAAGLVVTGSEEPDGLGLAARGQRRSEHGKVIGSLSRQDKSKLKCSHCGMMKHTKDQCFKLVGFPDWWNDGHKKQNRTGETDGRRATAAVGNAFATGSGGNILRNAGDEPFFEEGGAADFFEIEDVTGHQDRDDHWAWH
ncbi:hypothetical protein SSX86_010766 [Deinandra increscens subsp. villosa]|uniref:Gag protein n=1 Tax=Deinandra increscens subsp. villosa TaxID=3103831 RepID=A0AAP0H2N3_9ASTR